MEDYKYEVSCYGCIFYDETNNEEHANKMAEKHLYEKHTKEERVIVEIKAKKIIDINELTSTKDDEQEKLF